MSAEASIHVTHMEVVCVFTLASTYVKVVCVLTQASTQIDVVCASAHPSTVLTKPNLASEKFCPKT